MELNEQQHIKMFDTGYLLQQHEPELLENILNSESKENEYIRVLSVGKQ